MPELYNTHIQVDDLVHPRAYIFKRGGGHIKVNNKFYNIEGEGFDYYLKKIIFVEGMH